MHNYLGIDWGEKEIGVALAHAETRLAMALAILPNDAQLWGKLSQLISDNEVGGIVVGVPEYQETGTMDKARVFSLELQKHFPEIKIEMASEMFTSKMATERLQETAKKAPKDHAEAARIILDSWLERGR